MAYGTALVTLDVGSLTQIILMLSTTLVAIRILLILTNRTGCRRLAIVSGSSTGRLFGRD